MKKKLSNIISIFLFLIIISGVVYTYLSPTSTNNKEVSTTNTSTPILKNDSFTGKINHIKNINKDSLSIILGIKNNEDTKKILSPSFNSKYLGIEESDFNKNIDSLESFIKRNQAQIITDSLSYSDTNDKELESRILNRLEFLSTLNENLHFLYDTIINFNDKFKKWNVFLLKFDVLLREKVSIWTFISKNETNTPDIEAYINNCFDLENKFDDMLQFLHKGWISSNTGEKLDVINDIDPLIKKLKKTFTTYDKELLKLYPDSYQYASDFIEKQKLKSNKK